MTTKLTNEQREAVNACAGHPVRVADEVTNQVYYLLNEEAFVHLCGLQSELEQTCHDRLRQLIDEGISGREVPAEQVFADLRSVAERLVGEST